jgi:ATP-binding cassette ChvD family protein
MMQRRDKIPGLNHTAACPRLPLTDKAQEMAQFIYTMNRVGKVVPPKRIILRDISLSFFPGAKIGVLGLNGSGKSTLLKIMAGVDKEIEGEARAQSGIKVGYLPQEPQLDETKTVREVVGEGVDDVQRLLDRFNAISDQFAEPMSDDAMNKLMEEQAKMQDKIDAVGGWELERKLEIAANSLRLPPWEAVVGKLSGGEKRRVALCRLLLSKPDMLLLDEPTNHLDAESVAWLEHFLEEYPSTVIAVTHDRYFLDNVAEWILELDRGHGIPWQGNYSSWLEQKEQRLAQEERQQDALAKTLKRELEWVRTNPKARQAKSKARLQRYEELASQEFQKRNETNEIYIPPGDRLGDLVIEARALRKGYGDRLLIDSLSFNLPAGGIVGIIGPNGAGKTTLFRMLSGVEKPDSGEIRLGPSVKLAYVDQSRQALNDKNSVWQEISGGLDLIKVGNYETSSRGYVGRFNFKGVQQQQLIGELSGGERNRVHLAKVLKAGGNVLLLDEPTNDLDIETLRALEDALLAFPGCAVVISHDRWFLDRIATHILAFEGNSEVHWFEGNYQEYVEDLKRRKGEDAAQPHRIRYKPLTG